VEKPSFLEIQAEDGRLFAIDQHGNKWWIRWCGNGAYSHWVLMLKTEVDPDVMFYVYASKPHYHKDEFIIKQIEEAEKRYGIYI
jgi:hypothetical protein